MSGGATVGDSLASVLRDQAQEIELLTAELKHLRSNADTAGRPDYKLTIDQIRLAAARHIPPGSTVAIASRGDEELLKLHGLRTWHFPRNADGMWSGQYPADGGEAVIELNAVRDQGAAYLILPWTARWWLEFYPAFAAHLFQQATTLVCDSICAVYDLHAPAFGRAYTGADESVYRHTAELLDALLPSDEAVLLIQAGVHECFFPGSRPREFLCDLNAAAEDGWLNAVLKRRVEGASYLVILDVRSNRTEQIQQLSRDAATRFRFIASRPGVCKLYDLMREAV